MKADIVKAKASASKMHWFFVIHEIIFSAPAQSRRHLPQRRRNSWPAGRTSAGSWTKHRGGSCCTPAGRPLHRTHARHVGQGVGDEKGQRREKLHLPEGQSCVQPMDRSPIQAGRRAGTTLRDAHPEWRHSGAVRQQMAALGAQGVQLLQPAFPPLGPAARVGQKMQQPPGQTLHHRQGAEGDEPTMTPATTA